ncbi:MAG: DUF2892 domain-containing protein [Gammaproteobacteria bacterium]|nr:DUF2892 domain-containing protein [Gammaproteobacteria bacterium]MDH5799514.1 DUF2892 domain-containing protein [Gammaproteobacteria bacterium]
MYNSESFGSVENLSRTSRLTRAMFGAVLIGYTMQTTVSPLGWLAVLPLLAIFPVFSAITGWSPVIALVAKLKTNTVADTRLSTYTRVLLGAFGATAIGSVYVASAPLGALAVLPLIGIYPVLAAILGEEPLSALFAQQVSREEEFESVIHEPDHREHREEYRHAA